MTDERALAQLYFDRIDRSMHLLKGVSRNSTWAKWTSHPPVLGTGHLALNFPPSRVAGLNGYQASAAVQTDGREMNLLFANFVDVDTEDADPIKPGLMHSRGSLGDTEDIELLAPGVAEGFAIHAVYQTGVIAVRPIVEGITQDVAGMTDDRAVGRAFLLACSYSIGSPKLNKFASVSTTV